jgi:hypothetical protein
MKIENIVRSESKTDRLNQPQLTSSDSDTLQASSDNLSSSKKTSAPSPKKAIKHIELPSEIEEIKPDDYKAKRPNTQSPSSENAKKALEIALLAKGADPEQAKFVAQHTGFIGSSGYSLDDDEIESQEELEGMDAQTLFSRGQDYCQNGDDERALFYYLWAAKKGDPEAHYNVGSLLMRNAGDSENQIKANRFFLRAAELKDFAAYFILANSYFFGHGVKMNKEEANRQALIGATNGEPNCMLVLSNNLLSGEGVKKDSKKAVFWAKMAYKNGIKAAMPIFEKCYESGNGISKDISKAAYWRKRSEGEIEMDKTIEEELEKDIPLTFDEAKAIF